MTFLCSVTQVNKTNPELKAPDPTHFNVSLSSTEMFYYTMCPKFSLLFLIYCFQHFSQHHPSKCKAFTRASLHSPHPLRMLSPYSFSFRHLGEEIDSIVQFDRWEYWGRWWGGWYSCCLMPHSSDSGWGAWATGVLTSFLPLGQDHHIMGLSCKKKKKGDVCCGMLLPWEDRCLSCLWCIWGYSWCFLSDVKASSLGAVMPDLWHL